MEDAFVKPWSTPLSTLDAIFLVTGGMGALVVVVRVIAQFVAGDLGEDGDGGLEAGDENGFQALSVHGLSSFFMMFGLVGLALSQQSGADMGWSILGGLLAGLASIWAIGWVFRLARGLQSSGTLPPQAATGYLGTVYLTIPPGGTGRVTVRIGQRLREMDAIHTSGEELPTGTPIRVVRVERSVAVVQPLTPSEQVCLNT